MSFAESLLGNVIPTILWSFIAMNFSFISFFGCDFVRLTFGAAGDETLFPNDEWFGLGLLRHQDFATNKTTTVWEHSSQCRSYTEFEKDMFLSTSMKLAQDLFIPGLALSAITVVLLLIFKFIPSKPKVFLILTFVTSTVSAILQYVTYLGATATKGDAVCSYERYGANVNGLAAWYVDYDPAQFPEYAYMRYFQGCELGVHGKIAFAAFVMQFSASYLMTLNLCFGTGKEAPKEEDGAAASPLKPIVKGTTDEEAPPAQADETEYENNPVSPPLSPSPGPENASEKFADDLSYDKDIEDEIRVEDDLSLAQESLATESVVAKSVTAESGAEEEQPALTQPKPGMSPLRSHRSIHGGTF